MLTAFQQLDATIMLFKGRRKLTTFEEVRKSIEESYHRKFEMKTFTQMVFVAPEFFIHTWDKFKGNTDYKLLIDIPSRIVAIIRSILKG